MKHLKNGVTQSPRLLLHLSFVMYPKHHLGILLWKPVMEEMFGFVIIVLCTHYCKRIQPLTTVTAVCMSYKAKTRGLMLANTGPAVFFTLWLVFTVMVQRNSVPVLTKFTLYIWFDFYCVSPSYLVQSWNPFHHRLKLCSSVCVCHHLSSPSTKPSSQSFHLFLLSTNVLCWEA